MEEFVVFGLESLAGLLIAGGLLNGVIIAIEKRQTVQKNTGKSKTKAA